MIYIFLNLPNEARHEKVRILNFENGFYCRPTERVKKENSRDGETSRKQEMEKEGRGVTSMIKFF